jgi:hypothetical protein
MPFYFMMPKLLAHSAMSKHLETVGTWWSLISVNSRQVAHSEIVWYPCTTVDDKILSPDKRVGRKSIIDLVSRPNGGQL